MLENVLPNSISKQKAVEEIRRSLTDLKKPNISQSIPKIFGVEGRAAQTYFQAWHGLKLSWAPSRIPIPASWHAIGARSMTWRRHAQNARHPVNAMLNYGYAMAASQVRAQVMAVGLDPSIGIMHGNRHNKMPLVSDLMESLRPAVDQQILAFAISQTFHGGDFTINSWGGCRLNPQLARAVAGRLATLSAERAVNGFLEQLR
jgi:CRISPR-associated protein Cas1